MEIKTGKYYLNLLKRNKQKFEREYGVTRIGIFGSFARGEQTENSDVDIMFDADKISLFRMSGFLYDLQELLGTKVDLVHNTDKLPILFKQRITKDIIYV